MGFSIYIADSLPHAPSTEKIQGRVHDELVYLVGFEENNPQLSGFRESTVQEIRAEASTDPA